MLLGNKVVKDYKLKNECDIFDLQISFLYILCRASLSKFWLATWYNVCARSIYFQKVSGGFELALLGQFVVLLPMFSDPVYYHNIELRPVSSCSLSGLSQIAPWRCVSCGGM